MRHQSAIEWGLSDLTVVISRDGEQWFAQGVQIDYATSGTSMEDVQERFVRGLAKSITMNLLEFGTLDNFLRYTPQKEIDALQRDGHTMQVDIQCVGERRVEELASGALPFSGKVRFLGPQPIAA